MKEKSTISIMCGWGCGHAITPREEVTTYSIRRDHILPPGARWYSKRRHWVLSPFDDEEDSSRAVVGCARHTCVSSMHHDIVGRLNDDGQIDFYPGRGPTINTIKKKDVSMASESQIVL